MHTSLSALVMLSVLGTASAAAQAVVEYNVINLGTLKAGDYNVGYGVNDSGQAVGYSSTNATNGPTSAFLYSAGAITPLATLGGNYNQARAINTSGQITGYSLTANGSMHAFLYPGAGGSMIDVGGLASAGPGGNTYSYGINDSGTVVGDTQVTPNSGFHLFTYNTSTGLVDLGTLPGGSNATGYSINNSGDIAGESDSSYSYFRAFDYTPAGGMVDIGTLGGAYASARGINNSNEVVGSSETATSGYNYHAYAWTAAGGMVDIGTLGTTNSEAAAVNDRGDIVGYAYGSGTNIPFIYHSNGVMTDLNTLISPTSGWTLSQASDISNSGDIVGVGYLNGSSISSAIELVPVSRIPGDANLDGKVDLSDLNIVLNDLGETSSDWTTGNFDGAATIDLTDLNDVLNTLGTSAPVAGTAAPEPASLALLGLGATGMVRRRRRR